MGTAGVSGAKSRVAIELVAAINAARAEGFPLAEVLAIEGLDARLWPKAELAWKQRLVTERADFARYEVLLAQAEDWLDRDVTPLGTDLGTWVAFLESVLCQSFPARVPREREARDERRRAPFARLGPSHEGGCHDRAAHPRAPQEADPGAHHRGRSVGAQAIALVCRERARGVPAVDDRVRSRGGSTGDLGLDRYALMRAQFEVQPEAVELLRLLGVTSEEQRLALDARWEQEFTRDPSLRRAFRHLVEHQKARLAARARAPAEPAPAVAAPTSVPRGVSLTGTSMALDLPRGDAIPFPRPIPGDGGSVEPGARHGEARVGSGTSLALDLPRGPAVPFVPPDPLASPLRVDIPPVVVPPGRASAKLDTTGDISAAIRGPAVPFVPLNALALPQRADIPPVAVPPGRASAKLDTTGDISAALRAPALPFADAAPRVQKSKLAGRAFFGQAADLRAAVAMASKPGPAAPPEPNLTAAQGKVPAPPISAPPQAPPSLSLEQHASMSVELGLWPNRAAQILARYRLTPETKAAIDAHYRAQIAQAPELRAAWQRGYDAYYAWIAKTPR